MEPTDGEQQRLVVVTGATGRLGQRVVAELLRRGVRVRATDIKSERRPPSHKELAELGPCRTDFEVQLCDTLDEHAVRGLLHGATDLVHLGAFPGPRSNEQQPTDREIFSNNVTSTLNLFLTAAEFKLRRIVFSSSAFVWYTYGNGSNPAQNDGPFGELDSEGCLKILPWHDPARAANWGDELLYLPLDEKHPVRPTETYGLSKVVGEEIGKMVARASTTTVAALRFTNVPTLDEVETFPLPNPHTKEPMSLVRWSYADPRDVVEAHVRCLDAPIKQFESFIIAQPNSRFDASTAQLIRENFGEHVDLRGKLRESGGHTAGVLSTAKAEEMLEWQARYDWRQKPRSKL